MQTLKRMSKRLNDLLNIDVWILSGNEINTRESITVVFAGSELQKNYIAKIVFDSNIHTLFLGKQNLFSLSFLIKKPEYKEALIFIEGHNFHRFLFKRKKDFFISLWLKSTVEIPIVAKNKSSKNDFRTIIKNNLSYHIADTIEEIDHFYNSMYLPTIEKRHQNTKIVMKYKSMLNEIYNHGGKLLLVKKENQYIAGVVIVTREKMPRIWSNGILDGETVHWETGAIAATYLFSSQYLFQQGYTKMNLGLSRSFLKDGVLQYKKKLGAYFKQQGRRGFIIKTNHYSSSTQTFFKNNPFAYLDKTFFCGAFFMDKKDPEVFEIKKTKSIYHLRSFKKFYIFEFQDNNSIVKKQRNFKTRILNKSIPPKKFCA